MCLIPADVTEPVYVPVSSLTGGWRFMKTKSLNMALTDGFSPEGIWIATVCPSARKFRALQNTLPQQQMLRLSSLWPTKIPTVRAEAKIFLESSFQIQ